MNSIDSILGMIATEAVEAIEEGRRFEKQFGIESASTVNEGNLPTMRYDLRLIKEPEGTTYWRD